MSQREIHYLGHATFEITTEAGTRVLIDPYITGNDACPYRREEIPPPDLILVSHASYDHLGDTLELALGSQCTVICDPAVHRYFLGNRVPEERVQRSFWGRWHQFRDVSVRTVESHHLSIMATEDHIFPGVPLGFVLSSGAAAPIYHPGDTSIFGDARLIGQLYQPKVGMLTIAVEMTPYEAALMAQWLGLEVAIPIHYRGEEAPREFVRCLQEVAPEARPLIMSPGQRINL